MAGAEMKRARRRNMSTVMPGLVPGIPVLLPCLTLGVDVSKGK